MPFFSRKEQDFVALKAYFRPQSLRGQSWRQRLWERKLLLFRHAHLFSGGLGLPPKVVSARLNFSTREPNNIYMCPILRSLSKDDGYGNKNVSPKYNLALSQVFRNYIFLFTLYNTVELCCNWMGTNGLRVKTENDWFIVICSRCRKNLKFGDFTLLFCGVRQKNARKSVMHVQHVYFSSFNQ